MLKVKLSQVGKKHRRSYRIVIAEARSKRDGKTVDQIGYYYPQTKPAAFKIDKERLSYWLSHGAQMTDKIKKLIKTT